MLSVLSLFFGSDLIEQHLQQVLGGRGRRLRNILGDLVKDFVLNLDGILAQARPLLGGLSLASSEVGEELVELVSLRLLLALDPVVLVVGNEEVPVNGLDVGLDPRLAAVGNS